MRIWPRSLFLKLSVSFWILVFFLSGLQFALMFYFWRTGENQRLQMGNWELATNIARELRPVLLSEKSTDGLSIALARIAQINPEIDLYILDKNGNAVAWSFDIPHGGKPDVPIDLIESFLASNPRRKLPLYGPNPGDPEYLRPFAVERIEFFSRPGYLYVVLGGGRSRIYRHSVLDRFLLVGGGVTSFLSALIAALLGTLIFSVITRRFRRLSRAVQSISAGSYSTRTGISGSDEVAQLGEQVDLMAKTIEESIEQIKRADESRRQMLANISHDLRGPITSLRAHLEMAQNSSQQSGKRDGELRIDKLLLTVDHLTQLIHDLFDLAKLESKEMIPHPEPFSLPDLVREEVFFDLKPFAETRRIALRFEASEILPLVLADPQMLYRVFTNLVKNAIGHTPEGGEVRVLIVQKLDRLRVTVSDTGVGIAPKDIGLIFERFYIGSGTKLEGPSGTGLGLAIVKQILTLHGADISVQSAPGQGAHFSFELPVCES